MTRLTDEEVWLRVYCSAITSAVDDRPSDVAESGLDEFRKRFPAKPSPAKPELVVEWNGNSGTTQGFEIVLDKHGRETTYGWVLYNIDGVIIDRSMSSSLRVDAQQAAVAALRKELDNA